MRKTTGRILLIDDDKFEKEFLEEALKRLHWDIRVDHYENPVKAFEYLRKTKDEIFLNISDMNMPLMSGLELKRAIDSHRELRRRAIPFIFYSTSASEEEVIYAYEYCVQGYFEKPKSVKELSEILDIVIKYWIIAKRPDKMK